jgi:hypothetical protein
MAAPTTPASPRVTVTVWPAPAVPLRTSVESLVMPSFESAPVSEMTLAMVGTVMPVSTVYSAEAGLTLPAASAAAAVKP